MQNSRVSPENRIASTGYGRFGLEAVVVPRTPWSAAEKVTLQPPIQPVSNRYPALEQQEITFSLLAPEAREVSVAGNFNGWRPHAAPMRNMGGGKWLARLMLRSGQYEYRLVVDGNWREDPGAVQRVGNAYGGFNSVLQVPLPFKTYIS